MRERGGWGWRDDEGTGVGGWRDDEGRGVER